MPIARRSVLAAAAAALAPAAASAQSVGAAPDWLRAHPAFAEWEAPTRSADGLLDARVEPDPDAPRLRVREWLGGRPTVLAVWATWCPPCLAEKRAEAQLSARLEAVGVRAQIKALLAYDRADLAEARARLAGLGASALTTARATRAAEQALLWIFGFDRDRRSMMRTQTVYAQLSTALPFTLLLDSSGGLLGRMTGMASDVRGRSYWSLPATFEMLERLA